MNRYAIKQSTTSGRWIVIDTKHNVSCEFEQGKFNSTQHYTVPTDIDTSLTASIARGIADWLARYHYAIAMGTDDVVGEALTNGKPGVMGAYIYPDIQKAMIQRAKDALSAWQRNAWQPITDSAEMLLERLVDFDYNFGVLWQDWLTAHGWTEPDTAHTDYVELIKAIEDTRTYLINRNGREVIGKQVAKLRKALGLTQLELAEKTGVHYTSINKIEQGRYNVSVDILYRIARALNAEIILYNEDLN